MKKKTIATVSIVVLLLLMMLGGTLAFFTEEEIAHNIITTGDISIDLIETDAEGKEFVNPTGVLPGAAIDKIVTVKNTCENPCWVRINVVKAIQLAEGAQGDVDLSLVQLDFDTDNWTLKDEYYYYNKALEAGATTEPLFTKVTFEPTMGNLYQKSTATVDVTAQAVQAKNNGDAVLDANGWPE